MNGNQMQNKPSIKLKLITTDSISVTRADRKVCGVNTPIENRKDSRRERRASLS